jgi:hypothetical protein
VGSPGWPFYPTPEHTDGADMTGGREYQRRRFSPATVAVLLRLPPSPARSFAVASALGKSIRRDSTFLPARHGKDVIGVWIGPTQRKAIIEELCITPRRFNQQIDVWVKSNIAHRCHRGEVCLWLMPFMDECPGCKQEPPVEKTLSLPMNRKSQVPNRSLTLPVSVPISGDALRMGRGMQE